MVTLCWAAKGGSGTTVVAAALALTSGRRSLLVDLDGELPAALGVPEPDRPGIDDWLASDAPASHLADLQIAVDPLVDLLPFVQHPPSGRAAADRARSVRHDERWTQLAGWLAERQRDGVDVVIDAGTGAPNAPLAADVEHRLLVTRPCYLALRRAVRLATRPTGIVLVDEPGHALSVRDVQHAIGAPVVAVVSFDPAIARAVDAGMLTRRLPGVIGRQLRTAVA
jgi:hypothetical protein